MVRSGKVPVGGGVCTILQDVKAELRNQDSSGKNQHKGECGSRREGHVRATENNSVWLKSGKDVREKW